MSIQEYVRSKSAKLLLCSLLGVIVLAFVFAAGVFVGAKKSRFFYTRGERGFSTMMGVQSPFSKAGNNGFGMNRFFMQNHMQTPGFTGQVTKLNGTTLTVKASNGVEVEVLVSSQTQISQNGTAKTINDLTLNSNVTVAGIPNGQGQIQATAIQLVP